MSAPFSLKSSENGGFSVEFASSMLKTPIALFIFNRPDLAHRVFDVIRAQSPERLLLVADGPRHEAERVLCEQSRAIAPNAY